MPNINSRLASAEVSLVEVHTATSTHRVEGMFAFDLDATLVDTTDFAANHHGPMLKQWVGDWGLSELSDLIVDGHGPYSRRKHVKDTLFLVEWLLTACRELGRTFPLTPDDALTASRAYHQMLLQAEKGIIVFDGVGEQLALMREEFPNAFVLLKTNCPDWLTPLRAGDLMQYFDGVVSIRPLPPSIADDDDYVGVFKDTQAFVKEQYQLAQSTTQQLNIAIAQSCAKPNTLGLRAALGLLDWPTDALAHIVSGGDDPTSEGAVARNVFDEHRMPGDPERVLFAHAAYAQFPHRESLNETAVIDAAATTPSALFDDMKRLYKGSF